MKNRLRTQAKTESGNFHTWRSAAGRRRQLDNPRWSLQSLCCSSTSSPAQWCESPIARSGSSFCLVYDNSPQPVPLNQKQPPCLNRGLSAAFTRRAERLSKLVSTNAQQCSANAVRLPANTMWDVGPQLFANQLPKGVSPSRIPEPRFFVPVHGCRLEQNFVPLRWNSIPTAYVPRLRGSNTACGNPYSRASEG